MTDTRPTTPCERCGTPTPMRATKRCDPCWELERRIRANPELARKILADFDYGPLLKKYMRHVWECEGTTFVGEDDTRHSDVVFTDEEAKILEGLRSEVLHGS